MDSGWVSTFWKSELFVLLGVVVCARLLAKLEFSRRCWVYCVPLLVWQVSEAGSCLTVSSLVLWRLMELWLNLPTIINNQGGTASSQQPAHPTHSHHFSHTVCGVVSESFFWQKAQKGFYSQCFFASVRPVLQLHFHKGCPAILMQLLTFIYHWA